MRAWGANVPSCVCVCDRNTVLVSAKAKRDTRVPAGAAEAA